MIKTQIISLFSRIKKFISREESIDYFIYVILFPTLFILVYLIINYTIFNQHYNKISDDAANGLQILRAKNFQELLGCYSRHGFNHPGPISFYYFAFMEKILWFKSGHGIHMVSQLLYNYIFLFCSLHIIYSSFKEKKYYAILFFISVLFSLWPLGAIHYIHTWPPGILVLTMLLFILASSKFAYGEFKYVLLLVISSSFAVQNYVGAAIIVVPCCIISLVLFLINKKRYSRKFSKSDIKYLIISSIFVLLVFFPVLYEQFTAETGNIAKIIRFLIAKGGLQQHPIDVADYLFNYFYNPIKNILPVNPYILVAFLIGIAILSLSRDRKYLNYLIKFMLLGLFLSLYGALSIKGSLFEFIFYFEYAFVSLFYFILIIFIFRFIKFENIDKKKYVVFLVIFFIIFISKFYKIKNLDPNDEIDKFIDIINPQKNVTYNLKCNLHSDRDRSQWVTAAGLAYRLLRDGYEVCVPDEWTFMFGEELSCSGRKNIIPIYFSKHDKKTDRVIKKGQTFIYKNTRIMINENPFP